MQTSTRRTSPTVSKARWLTYATASAATVLAGRPSLEAEIHYSGPLNFRLPDGNHQLRLQLDQRGDSIGFEHRTSMFNFSDPWAGFKVTGRQSAAFRGPVSIDYHYVGKLQRSDFVSKGHFTQVPPNHLAGFGLLAGGFSGYFIDRGTAFVGFAFNGGAGIQYGWARVRMNGYQRDNGFEVIDYAYADPGESIQAGQMSSSGEKVSEMGSLGLLALGAAGLLDWRRRRRSNPASLPVE